MTRVTLAVNGGSSSVKCALFTFAPDPVPLGRASFAGGTGAASAIADWARAQLRDETLTAIGHRLVHGGPSHVAPQQITTAVLQDLAALIPFAPNHLPAELALIEAVGGHFPSLPQFVCFDTAFHAGMPDVAARLPVPSRYAERGVRRYGFHGLSYAYIMEELRRAAGDEAAGRRIVLAHLGSGSSLAAVRDGRSIDTTMGMTPLGGVVMATRTGDLDPGVLTHIARSDRLSPDQLEDLVSAQSGMLGISGSTGDMQTLLAGERGDERCRAAVAAYVYSVRKAIGALAAALEGLDAIVFSGGIGEHSPAVRARICAGLEFLGVTIDAERNAANAPIVSRTDARVELRVIPTNEELVIARAAWRLLAST